MPWHAEKGHAGVCTQDYLLSLSNPDNYVRCNTVSENTNWVYKGKEIQGKANEMNWGMVRWADRKKKCWANKETEPDKWRPTLGWEKIFLETTKMAFFVISYEFIPNSYDGRKKLVWQQFFVSFHLLPIKVNWEVLQLKTATLSQWKQCF